MIIDEDTLQNTETVRQVTLHREQLTDDDWLALESGYANYCSEKLEKISSKRLVVKKSAASQLWTVFMIFFFLIAIVFSLKTAFSGLSGADIKYKVLTGLVFFVIGSLIIYAVFQHFMADDTIGVFDKRLDRYWEGDAGLTQESEIIKLEKHCRLSAVVAVQLLSGTHTDCNGNDPSPIEQLNLVLADKSRVNILAYSATDRTAMLSEAAILGDFLSVPVWADIEKKRAKNAPLFAQK